MKITLVIKSLVGGGAEKVLVLLAKGFVNKGFNVTVITMSGIETDAYTLDHRISRVDIKNKINHTNFVFKNYTLLKALKKEIRKSSADVVISFVHMVNIRVLLAMFGTKLPTIVTEHTDPARAKLSLFWKILRRILYPFADSLVCVSEGVKKGLPWAKNSCVIYNPIDINTPPEKSENKVITIGAMGRLHYAKGFDLLIDSFSQIQAALPLVKLVIYGEGSQRETLEKKIIENKLSDSVTLAGFVENANDKIAKLDLFVVSSRYEGFCLVLAEAMAAGIPCVSFNCPSGPSEIISHEYNGLLVSPLNTEALAQNVIRLLNNTELQQAFIKNGYIKAEQFKLAHIMVAWEQLFFDVLNIEK